MPKNHAFTLIELSIVLVIIGLIIGVVLVGGDLIKAAQVRQQVTQIEQISTKVNTFRLKYNCLPGDCRNATQFFAAAAQPEQVTNGDGDGMICGLYSAGAAPNRCNAPPTQDDTWGNGLREWRTAWDHLSAAGLTYLAQYDETDSSATTQVYVPDIGNEKMKITSSGTNAIWEAGGNEIVQGGVVFGNEPAVSYNTGGHRIRIGVNREDNTNPNRSTFYSGLNPSDAQMLDAKIDEGRPYSGTIVAMAPYYTLRIPGWSGTAQNETQYCGDSLAANNYRKDASMGANLRGCALSIKAGF